jgi:hypothetical protein
MQTIRGQVALDVDSEIASVQMELKAKNWQQKEAAATC